MKHSSFDRHAVVYVAIGWWAAQLDAGASLFLAVLGFVSSVLVGVTLLMALRAVAGSFDQLDD